MEREGTLQEDQGNALVTAASRSWKINHSDWQEKKSSRNTGNEEVWLSSWWSRTQGVICATARREDNRKTAGTAATPVLRETIQHKRMAMEVWQDVSNGSLARCQHWKRCKSAIEILESAERALYKYWKALQERYTNRKALRERYTNIGQRCKSAIQILGCAARAL